MKFVKYSWGYTKDKKEAYAIVQPLNDDDFRVKKLKHFLGERCNKKDASWGILIYGSKVKYLKSGKVLYFTDIKKVTELNTKDVLNEHFTGLI